MINSKNLHYQLHLMALPDMQSETFMQSAWHWYLQWTKMGPQPCNGWLGACARTPSTKSSNTAVFSGQPKSGQEMKCKCLTTRFFSPCSHSTQTVTSSDRLAVPWLKSCIPGMPICIRTKNTYIALFINENYCIYNSATEITRSD